MIPEILAIFMTVGFVNLDILAIKGFFKTEEVYALVGFFLYSTFAMSIMIIAYGLVPASFTLWRGSRLIYPTRSKLLFHRLMGFLLLFLSSPPPPRRLAIFGGFYRKDDHSIALFFS